jgi:hypothetical protein
VLQELDTEGEWYVDKTTRKIYYWPPAEHVDAMLAPPPSSPSSKPELVVSQLATVMRVAAASPTALVTNIVMAGVTFAHTTTMYVGVALSCNTILAGGMMEEPARFMSQLASIPIILLGWLAGFN